MNFKLVFKLAGVVSLIAFSTACSGVKFNQQGSSSSEETSVQSNLSDENNQRQEEQNYPAQSTAKVMKLTTASITGMADPLNPVNFLNIAVVGTTIQLHYWVQNATTLAYYIFPAGADMSTTANLARGNDLNIFGLAANLSLPMPEQMSTYTIKLKTPSGQFLPIGNYTLALFYCDGTAAGACKNVQIPFGVVPPNLLSQ